MSQVYSFVPIPGAQQHKRPRRRYEEIERMYKCGWNGCEKAYGTLNHLNAHVTMQSHGQKRTPEGMLALLRLDIQPGSCLHTQSRLATLFFVVSRLRLVPGFVVIIEHLSSSANVCLLFFPETFPISRVFDAHVNNELF